MRFKTSAAISSLRCLFWALANRQLSALLPTLFFALGFVVSAAPLHAQPSFKTPVSYEDADKRAGEILAKMKLEEKVQLISGYNSFYIHGFPQYGMPDLYLSDATAGVNIRRNLSNQLEKSTSFPAPLGLAATWNPGLAYQYAHSVGEECRAGGIAVLLGPGMNIYRIAQCGRNFEYFGEDPFLAARMVEKYVSGVLDTGTIPTLKHFAANNTDYYRRTSNSVVDERTLHEIYLPAFKAGIDAGAMAVMTSYNQINGEYAGQSYHIITELLRQELGFRWLVMSDWWSVWDAEKIIQSGLDLEMPGDKFIKADALRLVAHGKVSEKEIDRMAKSIIRTCAAMGLYDRPVKDDYFLKFFREHEKIATQTGREAIVLLKNNGILPVKKDSKKKILVTGLFVDKIARGGGAADVEGYNVVTLLDALKKTYGDRVEYVKSPSDEQLSSAEVLFVSTGTFDSEGWDHSFALPDADEAAVRRAVKLNPHTVVIVNAGGGIKMTDWNDAAAAVIYAWYPGQAGSVGLAEILAGETSPSGKLPISIEKTFEDSPGANYIPKGEKLYSGWDQDNNMSHPVYNVEYKEGVFVGYRWYESKKILPLYAFGHGLSYGKFEYRDLRVSPASIRAEGGRVTLEFSVKNASSVAAAEVAQVYVRQTNASVQRPERELKGFSKVTIPAGETKVFRIRINAKDLGFWDVATHAWKTEPGEYKLFVGGASDEIKLEGSFRVE